MAKSDRELGNDLWPGLTKEPEGEQAAEKGERPDRAMDAKSVDERTAEALWPPRNERYPHVSEGGHVLRCIRNTAGNIIAESDVDSVGKVAQRYGDRLDHADLSQAVIDCEVEKPTMQDSDCSELQLPPGGAIVHGDLRGTRFDSAQLHGSLRFCDLRGVRWAGANVSNLDLTGSVMDPDSYIELSQCEGFASVKGATMPNRHVLPKAT
jgi:hypothetical protein